MNKLFNKNLIVYCFTIIAFIIGTLLWGKIEFKYANPEEVVGYYSIFKYSPLNDNFRFILFISFVLLTYLLSFIYFNKIKINICKNSFILERNTNSQENISLIFLYALIIIQLIFFFSKDLNFNPIDLFHEGQALSGALNFKILNRLWSNSFVITSLFVDILNANIAWNLFEIQSLSSYRFFIEILNLICSLLILIFIFKFTNGINLNKNLKTVFYVFLVFLVLILTSNNTFSYRDIPLFIFLIIVYEIFCQNKNLKLNSFFLGILPIISLLWSLDRGIFIIAGYIPLILILSINQKIRELLIIFTFLIISIISFYILIGQNEFLFFLSNSYDILRSSDLLNGIIHPIPFTNQPESSRATKNLLIIIINGILVLNYILRKQQNLNKNLIIFILFYYFLSLIFYKIGVTRSDGGHLKQAISLNIILLLYFVVLNLLILINKKFNIKKNLIISTSYLLILLLFVTNLPNNFIENISSFKSRYKNYINLDDQFYLNISEKNLIQNLKNLTQNEKCFQIFSYETAISYFLNKPSCTKFYHIMNMGPKKNQFLFIKELKEANPVYILIGGNYQNIGNMKGRDKNELSPKYRFVYIDKFINENYKIFKKVDNWQILIQN
tara:strand:+ start:1310 stop:3148 length:1839 start_codon:yes stop_codon:yes gene_type:complete